MCCCGKTKRTLLLWSPLPLQPPPYLQWLHLEEHNFLARGSGKKSIAERERSSVWKRRRRPRGGKKIKGKSTTRRQQHYKNSLLNGSDGGDEGRNGLMENENGRRSELVVCVGMCRRNTLAYSYSAVAAGWGPVKVIEERVREEVGSSREEEREMGNVIFAQLHGAR